MTPTFTCRLSFFVSHSMDTDNAAVEVTHRGSRLEFRPHSGATLRNAKHLVAISRNHPSPASARSYGAVLKEDLLRVAIAIPIGVDVGKERERAGPGQYLVDSFRSEYGVTLLADVHGISVYEDNDSTMIFGGSATGCVLINQKYFTANLANCSMITKALSRIERISAELLSASFLSESSYAKLLLAVAAVEALSSRGTCSPEYLRLLECARAAVLSCGTSDDSEYLIRDLDNLSRGRISIRQACLRNIRHSLGEHAANDFKKIYDDTRSTLLHGKAWLDSWEAQQPAWRAQEIARELFMQLVPQWQPLKTA